jgi:hypothetical protein
MRADYRWSFDCGDVREDLTGLYNGTMMHGADFRSPDFPGQGLGLQLNRLLNQYVTLPRSLNLTLNTSFTLSTWIRIAGYRTKTILSDCNDYNLVCILFIITDTHMMLRVMNWNNATLLEEISFSVQNYVCQACWIYLTYLFDSHNGSTIFYFNGYKVGESNLTMAYSTLTHKKETKRSYMGGNALTNTESFYGVMDQLSVTYYVKNQTEILYEATTLCLYTFETNDMSAGTGPNSIRARTQHVYRSFSNNKSVLLLNTTDSYFQSTGFTLLDSNSKTHTIAFWLRLKLTNSSIKNNAITVLQLTSLITGLSSGSYTCVLSLHVYPNTGTYGYFFPALFEVINVNNSLIENNTWVHLAIAYDTPDTYLFYQNGILIHTSIKQRYSGIIAGNPRFSMTIGGAYLDDSAPNKPDNFEQMKCFARIPILNYTQMYGEIDNLTVVARTLPITELATLAGLT